MNINIKTHANKANPFFLLKIHLPFHIKTNRWIYQDLLINFFNFTLYGEFLPAK
jgi:hypothetical protein